MVEDDNGIDVFRFRNGYCGMANDDDTCPYNLNGACEREVPTCCGYFLWDNN